MMLTDAQQKMFADASARRGTMDKLSRANAADAETLNVELRGIRVVVHDVLYEITRINSAWPAGFEAHGRRILKDTGKPGAKTWRIGRLIPQYFESAK